MLLYNLQPKSIIDFNQEDTIYIKTEKNKGHPIIYLCQFVSWNGRVVTGKAISTDTNPKMHEREIAEGLELTGTLANCLLYGKLPKDTHDSYKWFMPTGYAVYPFDYDDATGRETFIEQHPAFGMAQFSRFSSNHVPLFGCTVGYNGGILLRISTGEVKRNLSREWYHAKDELIEVHMSELQFAELITSFNTGTGIPCTIQHVKGVRVPDPPYEDPLDRASKEFAAEMRNMQNNMQDYAGPLEALMNKPSLTKDDKKMVIDLFNRLTRRLGDSIPFMQKSFGEKMEETVHEAKAKVREYVASLGAINAPNLLEQKTGNNYRAALIDAKRRTIK